MTSASSREVHSASNCQIENDIDVDAVDRMLSGLMNQMSFEERNAMQEEIHGVKNLCPDETPDKIQISLKELSDELARISIPEKDAFNEAQTLPTTYVNQEWFQLRFLRAEVYDITKAAKRLLRFVDLVKKYFGVVGLQRPIQLSDLSVLERKCLGTGCHQLLPYRDRSGRRIFAAVGNFAVDFPLEARMKVVLYIMWAASDDIETQRRGILVIIWPNPDLVIIPDYNLHVAGRKCVDGYPLRGCALHMCFAENFASRMIKAQIGLAMSEQMQQRLKIHLGTRTEIEYSLQSFGIYVDQIPVTESGKMKLQNLHQWMKVRKVLEKQQLTSLSHPDGEPRQSIIECPGLQDVIFRSGNKVYMFHPGNLLFRNLVEANFEEHENAQTQSEKADITRRVIKEILVERRGRFVVWDKGAGWYTELTNESQIREKVAVYIREFKKRIRAMDNRQVSESSTEKFQLHNGNKRRRFSQDDNICCA
ncbi:hypothetical protein IV203_013888 [Nitzschia inconspicua]|uniref:DUF6824 domain-containing protein n=1 Tax=Nitzschia inconspicua TaxID=303405 RepID=A0A9K3M6Y7_9STRA|nr:hypothetical protein IV203_013888 [Nitzschia inconspicua]